MTKKNELYKLIDELNESQFDEAKDALTNILQGKPASKVPVCDLGSCEDIATLFETVIYDDKDKI